MSVNYTAALIYGTDSHHLDHLAPLCQILNIPLIVTEESISIAANQFYPDLTVLFINYPAITSYLITHYNTLFCSLPRTLFDEVFFFVQQLARKKINTIWCPHGNSDKGYKSSHLQALAQEEIVLVYGQQMIDLFKLNNVFNQLKTHIVTGNFRYLFYQQHRLFYDTLAHHHVFQHLPQTQYHILYAPTWKDYEHSSSVLDATPFLLKNLPSHCNLIIKIHPNLLIQETDILQQWKEQYASNPRIIWVTDFPAIYPLLNQIDIYIGDMSSIGYDFLTFNRPLFFLQPQHEPQPYLYRCGTQILPNQYPHIYSIIDHFMHTHPYHFSKIQTDVYNHAFEQTPLTTLIDTCKNTLLKHSLTLSPS